MQNNEMDAHGIRIDIHISVSAKSCIGNIIEAYEGPMNSVILSAFHNGELSTLS